MAEGAVAKMLTPDTALNFGCNSPITVRSERERSSHGLRMSPMKAEWLLGKPSMAKRFCLSGIAIMVLVSSSV